MPIPKTNIVNLNFTLLPTDVHMLNLIKSLKNTALKFEDNLEIEFSFFKQN